MDDAAILKAIVKHREGKRGNRNIVQRIMRKIRRQKNEYYSLLLTIVVSFWGHSADNDFSQHMGA